MMDTFEARMVFAGMGIRRTITIEVPECSCMEWDDESVTQAVERVFEILWKQTNGSFVEKLREKLNKEA